MKVGKSILSWVLSLLVFTFLTVSTGFTGTPLSDERVKEAKTVCGVQEVDVEGAKKLIANGAILLDVREYTEYKAGHIPGAIWAPRGLLDFKAYEWLPDKEKVYLVYCKTGGRGVVAACDLKKLGYKNVYNLKGGFDGWKEAKQPIETGEPEGFAKGIKKAVQK
ncbi:rhodanese-like domain-containing protein [Thermodesulfobacterium sp. TA1]|uniref:rhodanese-like domain-containing protein n=1 Tax=Thermodesulfobacterium sp. TA1 TaxID=2234087 RepID=UPI001232A55C|nr:rhodanese-like domain-containing protein [Thermodesulfobacterium sp. TA1]QER41606.1 rhodanese-like domain-containing protein [Thermodesulfobacterium sp. TA1]